SFSRRINWRQDSSLPKSMRTKRMERSLLGGLTSMPTTEKSSICDNRRVPKFPDTPVTTTTGFPLSIGFNSWEPASQSCLVPCWLLVSPEGSSAEVGEPQLQDPQPEQQGDQNRLRSESSWSTAGYLP